MDIRIKAVVAIASSVVIISGCGSKASVDPQALVASGCSYWSQDEGKFSDPDKALADFTAAAEASSENKGILDAATFYIKTAKNQTSESGIEADAVNTILGACA